jgi:hypothetical protein
MKVNFVLFLGNTALHMGVEYDYYKINQILIGAGADQVVENAEGAKAITGLSGSKVGQEAWDNPVTILKTVKDDLDELNEVFKALENASVEDIKKEELVRVGMAKKRELKAWKDGECAFFFLARLLLADFASTQRRSSTRFAFFETGGPHLLTGSEKCVFNTERAA